MKEISLFALMICFLAGCVQQRALSIGRVGPEPGRNGSEKRDTTNGTLVVYSAWLKTGTLDTEHQIHSDYKVIGPDGKTLHIRNFVNPMLEDPEVVTLAPGAYTVKVRLQGFGRVSVPVVIESNRRTTLYLDDTTRLAGTQLHPGDGVALPDGRIIGWASPAGR